MPIDDEDFPEEYEKIPRFEEEEEEFDPEHGKQQALEKKKNIKKRIEDLHEKQNNIDFDDPDDYYNF